METNNNEFRLNKQQIEAVEYMTQGKNIFLTGGAGVGKTAVLKFFFKMNKHLKKIAITSTTGTSAILLNGSTLHSFLGIGLGTASVGSICTKITKKKYLRERWKEMEVLVIDEISMLSAELFDKLEEIARIVRKSKLPFGGIQLLLSGDFTQLRPIDSDNFCFEADSWNFVIQKIVYLTEIIRQNNKLFQECLKEIRLAQISAKTQHVINKRVGVQLENEHGIIPTELYAKNDIVNSINKTSLKNLSKEGNLIYEYDLEFELYKNTSNAYSDVGSLREKYLKSVPAMEKLELCKGCQVMLLYNLDIENKLINGSRGIVKDFVDDIPIVKFLNGIERLIDWNIWEIEESDTKIASITQIPLKLGYAFSIHKIQGCSLDLAIMDLSEIFDYGMAYVALSRLRNLEGLSIISIDWNKIKIHPKAKIFYEQLS
jgi:ATP-dependent DNA helicase PIF1